MPRVLLINEQPSFASIGYSHQQLSPVPRGTANRRSQFHCPKSKMSKSLVCTVLEEEDKTIGNWVPLSYIILYGFSLLNFPSNVVTEGCHQ